MAGQKAPSGRAFGAPKGKLRAVFARDVPAIYVFKSRRTKNVDARHKAGHDGSNKFGERVQIAA